MAEHEQEPVETGAPMDYAEHNRTYDRFLTLTKYTTAHILILLIVMALFFFAGWGMISSIIAFIVLSAVAIMALR